MALHIRTGVYAQTAQTQDPQYLSYHPHFNIYFGFTSPQWPNILGQKSMYKQHRPRLSGSTLFAIPLIFIFILCAYIIRMSMHINTEVNAKTGHTQTCTICHITHNHVITSPQWPSYWDRNCTHYQNVPTKWLRHSFKVCFSYVSVDYSPPLPNALKCDEDYRFTMIYHQSLKSITNIWKMHHSNS